MTFRFLIPGKCRQDFLLSGYQEYVKRISKFGKVTLTYLSEEPLSDHPSQTEIRKALEKEAERNLRLIREDDILFLCDIHGKEYDSASFSEVIKEKTKNNGNLVFLFGSSYGLDDSLRKRADVSFSLSKLTFTHYMALLLTLEQVYRSLKILHGQTYDK